jgi:hypothetical protein
MLGFDAEERLIQKLPQDFAAKVVWGSRYPTPRCHERLGCPGSLTGSKCAGAADRPHDGRQRPGNSRSSLFTRWPHRSRAVVDCGTAFDTPGKFGRFGQIAQASGR